MPVSFRKLFSIAGESLPDEAIPPPIISAVNKIAPVIASCCSSCYLEWHLSAPQRSDLLCSLTFNNRKLLGRQSSAGNRLPIRYDGWDRLFHFIDSWKTINERLDGRIPHVWLAFDYNSLRERLDPPNIHYCIDKQFSDRRRSPGYTNRLTTSAFNRTLDLLSEPYSPVIAPLLLSAIRNCFTTLTNSGGEVIHLSFMHSRTPPVIKLNMTVPSSRLTALLDTVHWRGDISAATALCRELTPGEERIKGNICFTENSSGRFELELEYNSPLDADPRRIAMLQTMVRHKLVTRTRMRHLLAWPGRIETTYRNKPYIVERWLDVKICFSTKGEVTAKPYFGFAPLPRIGWKRERYDD
jgi:hypothetical protein